MNKRDMQQLKASIAKDLVQGQGDNSATRDLLKQYVPLNGIVSKPEPDIRHETPVENCLAPRATVARGATIKNDDDDIKNKSSSSKGEESEVGGKPVENHTCAVAPREKETADFLLVREAYEKATGNRWSQSRVAKMEAGDSSVSLDLLVCSILALGVSGKGLIQSLSTRKSSHAA